MACMANHQCAWLSIGLCLVVNAGAVERPERQNPAPSPCEVSRPTATFSIPHRTTAPGLNIDPNSPAWRDARSASIGKDCSRHGRLPDLKTEVRRLLDRHRSLHALHLPYRIPQPL